MTQEIKLNFSKTSNPCTYAQVEYASSLGLEFKVSTSQVMKRMDKYDMSEIIDKLKNGEKIRIV